MSVLWDNLAKNLEIMMIMLLMITLLINKLSTLHHGKNDCFLYSRKLHIIRGDLSLPAPHTIPHGEGIRLGKTG